MLPLNKMIIYQSYVIIFRFLTIHFLLQLYQETLSSRILPKPVVVMESGSITSCTGIDSVLVYMIEVCHKYFSLGPMILTMILIYSAGPDTRITAQSCSKPLPTRVPGQSYSFSDHEAVDAVLKIVRRDKDDNLNGLKQVTDRRVHHFKKARSIETRLECVKSVEEAIKVHFRYATPNHET